MKENKTWINPIFKFEDTTDKKWKKIISFSQLSKYATCPRRWKLTYIDRIKEDKPSIDLVFGNAMHEVAQLWVKESLTKSAKAGDSMDFESLLKTYMKQFYLESVAENNGVHFSTPSQLAEYYSDGVAALNYLRKKRKELFSSRKTKIIAIELPILYPIDPEYPGVKFNAYLDLVLYDVERSKFLIKDFKTSKKTWNDYKKKDNNTTDQLVLYKRLFSQQYDVPEDDIEVEFVILKRKINEDSMWVERRTQYFAPSQGKISTNKATKRALNFVHQAFNKDGTFKDAAYPAFTGPMGFNCTFCPFNDNEQLCPSKNRIKANFEL